MAVITPPQITPPPAAPQRRNRETFRDRVDDFITWMIAAVAQFMALAQNVFLNAGDAAASAGLASTKASDAAGFRDTALQYRDAAADAAIAAASSAAAAAQLTSTSTTSATLQTGDLVLQTQAGAGYKPGAPIMVIDRNNTNRRFIGTVFSYIGPTLALQIQRVEGTGTGADWNITVTGDRGPAGPVGGLNGGTTTGKLIMQGSATELAALLTNAAEVVTLRGTALTGTVPFDVTAQSVMYFTTAATGPWTPDITGSAGASLGALLDVGQSLSVVLLATQGTTAYKPAGLKLQGVAVTPFWQGGLAPAAGYPSGIDSYTYTIIKTASNAFTVLASLTQFKQ